jgi:hypothetical protein
MIYQQQIKINEKGQTSLEATKPTVLKRKVGYGEMNEMNEEEQARSEKRNKMDVTGP